MLLLGPKAFTTATKRETYSLNYWNKTLTANTNCTTEYAHVSFLSFRLNFSLLCPLNDSWNYYAGICTVHSWASKRFRDTVYRCRSTCSHGLHKSASIEAVWFNFERNLVFLGCLFLFNWYFCTFILFVIQCWKWLNWCQRCVWLNIEYGGFCAAFFP